MEAQNQCVTNIAKEHINHPIFQYEKQFSIFYKKKKKTWKRGPLR